MTAKRIAEIQERCDRILPGPWFLVRSVCDYIVRNERGHQGNLMTIGNEKIAEFVACAREDIPWLLGQLDAANRRAEEAEKQLPEADAEVRRLESRIVALTNGDL